MHSVRGAWMRAEPRTERENHLLPESGRPRRAAPTLSSLLVRPDSSRRAISERLQQQIGPGRAVLPPPGVYIVAVSGDAVSVESVKGGGKRPRSLLRRSRLEAPSARRVSKKGLWERTLGREEPGTMPESGAFAARRAFATPAHKGEGNMSAEIIRELDHYPAFESGAVRLLEWMRRYFDPVFLGSERLDGSRPALFVGNHARYGFIDIPLIVDHLYREHGLVLRSLGDRSHMAVPYWRDFLTANGMVVGTPENCDALMEAGESILVFPGGAREVMRRRDEDYQLIWKNRVGFARMAAKHGYDIIPFASLGADECFSVLMDANDFTTSRLGRALLRNRRIAELLRNGDVIPPVSRGLGPTLLPRPQRFYFSFGERIPAVSALESGADEQQALFRLREQVAGSITRQLDELRDYRRKDRTTGWGVMRRLLAPVRVD